MKMNELDSSYCSLVNMQPDVEHAEESRKMNALIFQK